MGESLNVIALISGGKDSFYSLLHCLQNGHTVVALGNLHPAPMEREDGGNEEDLNSFMYQTVGHTVIPLYEQALGIPLYRQEIVGSALQTGKSYSHAAISQNSSSLREDETESLIPLLKRIMKEHPTANAISTGAILSTYQRTRIESVALRLGLTPLSYLWKYPILPPDIPASLLHDMQAIGLDARIIKVASGGLDEGFLWDNVGSEAVIRRVERSMKRFGMDGDGAILGEGGEFETLVVDGPGSLFKGRIVVEEGDRRIVREGGGSAWLSIANAKVVMKGEEALSGGEARLPEPLDERFKAILRMPRGDSKDPSSQDAGKSLQGLQTANNQKLHLVRRHEKNLSSISHWTFFSQTIDSEQTITEETSNVVQQIRQKLLDSSIEPTNIISTTIVLRSMGDFTSVNKIYSNLFPLPNPPARVTISSGNSLSNDINLLIHLKVHRQSTSLLERKALHVQSRSYWAPANIGPYSQAIAYPLASSSQEVQSWAVSVAGQIPLVPATMSLPTSLEILRYISNSQGPNTSISSFTFQAILSLQHLFRIGIDMNVQWWTYTITFIPSSSPLPLSQRASIITNAWKAIHAQEPEPSSDNDEERDLWEEKHFAGREYRDITAGQRKLPDWDNVQGDAIPPAFVVEVEELPRGAGVEWCAGLGVVDGNVETLQQTSNEEGWAVYQCVFGDELHSIIAIDHCSQISKLTNRLNGALKALNEDSAGILHEVGVASYLDVSSEGCWDLRSWKGAVPCKGIWDSEGRRLSAVLILGTC